MSSRIDTHGPGGYIALMDVKQLRTRIGWSQARMAAELGVSRTTVTQWESGTSRPEVDTAWALVDLATEHQIRMRLQDALPRSRGDGPA